jgi:hypothetical protein
MTATEQLSAPASDDGATTRPVGVLRRNRGLLLVVGLVASGLVVLLLAGTHGAAPSDPLEPENPAPEGAQAVARVLADHGVQVTLVRGESELLSAGVDQETTLFVTSTDELSAHTSRQLRRVASGSGALVLAGASPATSRSLRLGVHAVHTTAPGAVPADCADSLLEGLELDVPPTTAHVPAVDSSRVETCFSVQLSDTSAGLVTRVGSRPTTYLVGAVALFSNGQVDEADHAAVALRLLGQHEKLVWYVADDADVPDGDAGSLGAMLPPWLGLVTVLAGLAVVATMLWRGRRLGPLVVEPLPVVVKAIESTASRGRLYSRARDRDHVARTLREATATRLAEQLRLPRDADPDLLVAAVAERVGRPRTDLGALLATGVVPDDKALTLLAQKLAELEREVRQP